jgi:hypothetical protein
MRFEDLSYAPGGDWQFTRTPFRTRGDENSTFRR